MIRSAPFAAVLFTFALLTGPARADDRQNWHRDFSNNGRNDHASDNRSNDRNGDQTDGSSRQAYQSGYQDGLTGHSHRGDHADGSVGAYTDGFQDGIKKFNQRDGYTYSRGYGRQDRHDYGYGSSYPNRQSNVMVVNPRQYQDQYYGQPGYYVQPYGSGYGGSQQIPNSALHSRTYYYSNGYGAYQ